MDLWSYKIELENFLQNLPPKLVRVVDKVKERRNLHIRKINMKDFDQEVERFKRVYNSSWERNWGFVPLTDPEIERMAAEMKPMLDPNIVVMVEREGEVIGVALSLPDLCQPLHKAYPRPGTPEIFKRHFFFNPIYSGRYYHFIFLNFLVVFFLKYLFSHLPMQVLVFHFLRPVFAFIPLQFFNVFRVYSKHILKLRRQRQFLHSDNVLRWSIQAI